MDVRSMVIARPNDAPRGAEARFCREYEISRSRFYEIRSRAESESVLSALQPRAPQRAARHSQAVDVEIEELAVRIRKELAQAGWDHGPLTVRHQIAALGLVAPAASTLARIFTRRGMVVAQPEKRPKTCSNRSAISLSRSGDCAFFQAGKTTVSSQAACAWYSVAHRRAPFGSGPPAGRRTPWRG